MENLVKAMEGLKLNDLKDEKGKGGSNLLEPTEKEVGSILAALKDGKSYKDIKKEVRRVEKDGEVVKSCKGFSYGQIKEIDMARQKKIVELTPKVVEGV